MSLALEMQSDTDDATHAPKPMLIDDSSAGDALPPKAAKIRDA